ncbi:MAG: TonB-dependent receptor [Candidatus Marinimicrobia bacterium]|nr:TonB-dependent receptor [Candidatus Neomarinimicrobiota bacterium]
MRIFIKTSIIIFSFLFAQKGSISGKVTDSTNDSPLIGANVLIEGTDQGAATDTEGRYMIGQLDPGTYKIIVSYIGFRNYQENIELGPGQEASKDLALEPEAIEMKTYVVTASRRRERVEDAPAAISVISKREIRRESNTNLGDYLKGTKGIDFTQSGIDSYNMTARGFNSSFNSRLLTLTDGRMANVPSLRLTAYNVIPVSFEDVEQIEVVLGPSSALYGPNAHSGVLNIVTSSPLRSTGTSVNIQGGLLNQADTDLLKKLTFRTAHKFGNIGIKLSGVALAGQDWTHFNTDEFEGHDPAFIGRSNFKHDRLDKGGILAQNDNNPRFNQEMIGHVEGSDESWIGHYWGDYISDTGGEDGSPIITQQMIDEASTDPFNRFTLPNGMVLWYVTSDKLGKIYADGVDNNGDGAIDELIDIGIDDEEEIWVDGIDNDGDGLIDESDELGSAWLDRFGRTTDTKYLEATTTIYTNPDSTWSVVDEYHKSGFGDYIYDSDGNIVFDTNNNGIYDDSWGSNGLDDDGDWGPYKDDLGNAWDDPYEEFVDLNGNGLYDSDVGETYADILGTLVLLDFGLDGVPADDANGDGDYDDDGDIAPDFGEGNGVWDGETYDDLNGNSEWDIFDNNDLDGNGQASEGEIGVDEFDEKDFSLNYGGLSPIYKDANDDGIDDFPEFKVRNYRYDLRVDWEPNSDFTFNLSHGFAWARNINITGIARYLADGWVYRYYQSRLRWKNLFLQSYLNTSYSGDPSHPTRNLATGSFIYDRSKKFSLQLQHLNEWKNGDLRFVWGLDYFLTMPDTRGTILSDKDLRDGRDNNGNGESGSPYVFDDKNDNTWYDDGERYTRWDTDDLSQFSDPIDSSNSDAVYGAISDGLDNDRDSDDFEDLNQNGIPDFIDSNGNGEYDSGETIEPGVQWLGGQRFYVFADGIDNDGDGKIDENIDEGIDEASEDNRYTVNELGAYYQVNWKINDKWEFIQATRLDVHDRLTDIVQFNNQGYGMGYSPFDWKFDLDKKDGIQVSPKIGLVHRPRENQNYRLTWAQAFNTPTNQALFLDIFVTRVSVFKVYARGADGGYVFPRDSIGNPYYYKPYDGIYETVDTSNSIYFYPSTDPKIEGFYGQQVKDLPEIQPEIVNSWEFGYKGRLSNRLFGTLDLYTSHYSSFVSPVTFITPIVVEKSVLETDYDGDGLINTIEDITNNDIIDQDDYDESFNNWRGGIKGVTAMDTIPGYTPPVVVGYINYGEVDMWGLDASLTALLNLEWSIDANYSYLGMNEFLNPITNSMDPINAPRHKLGMKLQYNSRRWPVTGSLNARYVDGFKWSSGIYFGEITPYTLFDIHLGYKVNKFLKANFTITNLLNHRHTEIIGGPSIGRVMLLRLQTTF